MYFTNLIAKYFGPKSADPDMYRKELVLNSLLAFCFPLIVIFEILTINHESYEKSYIGCLSFLLISSPFIGAYYLSRKGRISAASSILIATFSVGILKSLLNWSILLPSTLLSTTLIITLTSVLISSRAGFISAVISGIIIFIVNSLNQYGLISVDLSWQKNHILTSDVISLSIFILFISGISWLSNRQTYISLKRAQESEKELANERDLLEIRVAERSKEIEHMQIEKMSQLYTFIEFGKISAGLIHDIMSPLTAISIELETNPNSVIYKSTRSNTESVSTIHEYKANTSQIATNTEDIKQTLDHLISSSRKIQDIIGATRKQIRHSLQKEYFNLQDVIDECLLLQQHRIRKAHIQIEKYIDSSLFYLGFPSLFMHIITNLLSNAIDTCADSNSSDTRHIRISAHKVNYTIYITIKDSGSGIPPHIAENIFDPFFTTKGKDGCGLGLSASKHIAEKYFAGNMTCKNIQKYSSKKHAGDEHRAHKKSKFKTSFLFSFPATSPLHSTDDNES